MKFVASGTILKLSSQHQKTPLENIRGKHLRKITIGEKLGILTI
jgi:hypothetical protein